MRLTKTHGPADLGVEFARPYTRAEQKAGFPFEQRDRYLPDILAHYRMRVTIQRGRKGPVIPLLAQKDLGEVRDVILEMLKTCWKIVPKEVPQ